ncbi:MAG: hypothetical protein MHPSP_003709, partial [Paramarteilia canceri]
MIWTWEGVVSLRNRYLTWYIGISKSIEAYIQTRILKRTLDTYQHDSQRHGPDLADADDVAVCNESSDQAFNEYTESIFDNNSTELITHP